MIRLVAFQASSWLPSGYPIEVAWVDENGNGEDYLIRPEPVWVEVPGSWGPESEAVHGISMVNLMEKGFPAPHVAAKLLKALEGKDTLAYSDSPGFDNRLVGKLLDLVDPPFDQPAELLDVKFLYSLSCGRLVSLFAPWDALNEREDGQRRISILASEIVSRAERDEVLRPGIRHRARPDAERLWRKWQAVRNEVDRLLKEERA